MAQQTDPTPATGPPNGQQHQETGRDQPVDEFLGDLRQLRAEAGKPPFRKTATAAYYSHTVLANALTAKRLPSLRGTIAFVRAYGGNEHEWRERWHRTNALINTAPAAAAATRSTGRAPTGP